MKSRFARFTALLAAVSLMLAGCGSSNASSTDNVIVLGMISDTSGSASAYSPYTTAGIKLAISQINANGGVLEKKLKLVSFSDGSDTTQTPVLVRKLRSKGAGFILMNSSSASAVAAKPVCASSDLVCLSPTNLSASIVQGENTKHTYILGPASRAFGEVYAKALNKAGISTLAMVADDSSTIQPYVEVLSKLLTKAGIEIVTTAKIPVKASDVSAQIARVKAASPEGVLVLSSGGQTEALVQTALHKQMPKVQRFSLASIGNQPSTWALAGEGALEGLVYISLVNPENPTTQKVADALAERGGQYSKLTGYALQGYDAVYLIKDALEKAGTYDPSKLNQAIQSVSGYKAHYGSQGFTISFGPDKHIGADGNCGIVLRTFGANNKPAEPWSVFQPSC